MYTLVSLFGVFGALLICCCVIVVLVVFIVDERFMLKLADEVVAVIQKVAIIFYVLLI